MFRPLAVAGLLVLAQSAAPPPPVVVVFETGKGTVEIEVDVAHAPNTAANFLRYVDAGAYDNGAFHRAVRPDTQIRKDVPIQVIQARRSSTSQGYPAIPLERTSVTGLKHLDGAVSMARSGPDTATSDFFVCIGDQPSLDFGGARNADGQGFAVFGRVITGMDVVKAIQASPVGTGETLNPPIAIAKASRKK